MTPAERQRRRRARLRDEVTEETQPADALPPMCSFCCKDSHEVDVLVRAPAEGLADVYICGDCAGLAWQATQERRSPFWRRDGR